MRIKRFEATTPAAEWEDYLKSQKRKKRLPPGFDWATEIFDWDKK